MKHQEHVKHPERVKWLVESKISKNLRQRYGAWGEGVNLNRASLVEIFGDYCGGEDGMGWEWRAAGK